MKRWILKRHATDLDSPNWKGLRLTWGRNWRRSTSSIRTIWTCFRLKRWGWRVNLNIEVTSYRFWRWKINKKQRNWGMRLKKQRKRRHTQTIWESWSRLRWSITTKVRYKNYIWTIAGKKSSFLSNTMPKLKNLRRISRRSKDSKWLKSLRWSKKSKRPIIWCSSK